MNDLERSVAAWLRVATPEPRRLISAEEIIGADSIGADVLGGARLRIPARRAWSPILTSVAVLAVVVLVVWVAAAVRSSHRSLPAAPKPSPKVSVPAPYTPAPSQPAPVASAPADFPALRIVGSQGSDAWSLTDTLSISTDGGADWLPVPLPVGVAASVINTVQVGSDGTVWLGVPRGQSIDLYRGEAGQWTRIPFTLDQPAGVQGAPPSEYAASTDGPIAAFVFGWGTDPIHSYTDLLLSTDGGKSFVQRPTNIGWAVTSVTFASAQVGVAVAGPAQNYVYRTANGGRTWTQLLGGDPSENISYGAPTVTASGIEILRSIGGASTNSDIAVLTSADQGATFRPTAQTPLRIANPVALAIARVGSVSGSHVWVPGSDRIYESDNSGLTWSTVPTAQSLLSLDLISATEAIGQTASGCSSDSAEQQCLSDTYLIATVDGGRTWHAI